MTATITPVRVAVCPETPDGIGYEVKRVFPNWASAQRGRADLGAINPQAYEPYTAGLCAGEPFDAPEDYQRATFDPTRPPRSWADGERSGSTGLPPPCDGLYPDGYGQAAAHAQLEAAVGEGEACSATGCVLKRDEP